MILNLTNYMSGTVRVCVKGAMPEKFINLCIAQHIFLWGITKKNEDFYVSMRLPDFFRIRTIARISRVRVFVISHNGLPFLLKKVKRRKMLLVGAIMCFLMLNIMASYIWFVDVTGLKSLQSSRIQEIAYQNGLRPGVLKESVIAKQIEKEILVNVPEIAWVGITFSGTRAVIEVVEKTMQKQEDKAPANIIAQKDGVITEYIVLAGQGVVKKGDTVKKGDMLIKGIVPEQVMTNELGQPIINNNPPQLIKANGIIKARIWYEGYGEAEISTIAHQRTGQREVEVSVNIGTNKLSLKKAFLDPNKAFENEVIHKKLPFWRNSDVIVESTINIYHEVDTLLVERTLEEARNEARSKALASVQSVIPETAHVISRSSEVLQASEPNLVRVKVSIETIEEIGQSVIIANQ